MGEKISIGKLSNNRLSEEIEYFSIDDEEFREGLIAGGKILGITPQLSKASIALNNNINFFLNNCSKHRIMFPLKDMIANDLCEYLINMYYSHLNEPVEDLNSIITEFMSRNRINRFFNSGTYYKDVCEAFRYQIKSYNAVVGDMYDFNIDKSGERVVSYLLSNHRDEHQVIEAHKRYHERLNNVDVLKRLNKIN